MADFGDRIATILTAVGRPLWRVGAVYLGVGLIGTVMCLWAVLSPSARPLDAVVMSVPVSASAAEAMQLVSKEHPAKEGWQVDSVAMNQFHQTYVLKRYTTAEELASFGGFLFHLWVGPMLVIAGTVVLVLSILNLVMGDTWHRGGSVGSPGGGAAPAATPA